MPAHRLRYAGLALALACDAAAADISPSDCSADAFQRVLTAAPAGASSEARALWFSDRALHWPGKSAAGRYRLYHAADGGMLARVGQGVAGAQHVLPLTARDEPELAARFPHVAAGVTLGFASDDPAHLTRFLRGQLLLVQEDVAGRVLDATGLQAAAALDTLYVAALEADDLGVSVDRGQTRFALWAPTAQQVGLCLHAAGKPQLLALQREAKTGIWRGTLPGDASGGYYSYLVDVVLPDGSRVRNRVTDPYALSLDADSRRSWIGRLDAPDTRPQGWQTAPRPAAAHGVDQVIYELHVRDFSIGDETVPVALRGKYGGFTAAESAGMRHLRALAEAGLSDVHLLPVFDLASIPEVGCVTPEPSGAPDATTQQAAVLAVRDRDCFNWGYDPLHFGAPEGSYASDARDGATRIREFRAMVQALHGLGLRVGMDVVYNHTSASGQQARAVLDRIVPGYYHRLDASGRVERSTCCDNTATEHAMMSKLMRDTLVRWVRDYRIDSFRFDLMGHQPREAMLKARQAVDSVAGRRIAFLGEGWNFGEVANGARFVQAAQGRLDGTGIATFNDRLRDAARGGGCCDSGTALLARQGWLTGLHYAPNAHAGAASREELMRAADLVRAGLAGSLRDFEFDAADGTRRALRQLDYAGQGAGYVAAPEEVVNYVENHDNPTLFDIAALKLPAATSAAERARVQVLGAALVAFAQGIAYYHAGIDVLRSKSLDRNSFDSGDWFNRLDWRYADNHFGSGLPPQPDNGADWPLLRPVLTNPAIKPGPAEIGFVRDAFRDLLRIRAASPLLRLRTAAEIRERLSFPNTGRQQEPSVVVGKLDGRGLPDMPHAALMYFVNADVREHTLTIPAERGQAWRLHPVHATGADARARTARYDAASSAFLLPARTAVVFVVE